jgi:hypothetical protein
MTSVPPTPDTLRNVWRALLAGIAIYTAIPWGIQPKSILDADSAASLLLTLMLVAALLAIGSVLVRRLLLQPTLRSADGIRATQLTVLVWGLAEAIALLGVVAFFLTGEARASYLFSMAAAGLLFVHRPSALTSS